MNHEIKTYLDGRVLGIVYHGKIDPSDALEAVAKTTQVHDLTTYGGLVADLRDSDVGHWTHEQLRDYGYQRTKLMRTAGTFPPTAVITSGPLDHGLANVVSAYNDAPMQVFDSLEDGLAWIQEQD